MSQYRVSAGPRKSSTNEDLKSEQKDLNSWNHGINRCMHCKTNEELKWVFLSCFLVQISKLS